MSDMQVEGNESNTAIAALDAELKTLIRKKFEMHWHPQVGRAADAPKGGLDQSALDAVMDEIKVVFDKIRLIDKKYKLPTIPMHK